MFLTRRQIDILKLKKKGLKPIEISRVLKTSVANVCTVEKTALKNVEKAENTVKFYRAFEAPVWITFPPGADLYKIPEILVADAKKHGITPLMDSVDIMVKLKMEAYDKIRGRLLVEDVNISMDEKGNINIY